MVAGVCGGERGGLGYFFYEEGIQPAGGVDLKLFRGSLSLFRQRVDLKSERDNLCARPVAPVAPAARLMDVDSIHSGAMEDLSSLC